MASPPNRDDFDTRDRPSVSGPSRWLSVKKKGAASRSKSRERRLADDEKSADSGESLKQERDRSNPLSGESLRNLFNKPDKGKEKERAIEEQDPNVAPQKVALVERLLRAMDAHIDINEIKQALASPYSDGEPTRAVPLIDIWQKSRAGIVIPYNKKVHMQGAINFNYVTCYLDALFFCMFAKLAVFECMLSFDFPKDKTGNKKRLARLLCLWVNLVRSGFLVREDVTRDIQHALAACGWLEAQEIQQQDTTEAFNFITDALEFPLQPLRMNIAHGGKFDDGDDKIAFERLLNVALPDPSPATGIKLEECLMDYFNGSPIKVERMAVDSEKKGSSTSKLGSTVEIVPAGTEAPTEIMASPLSIHAPEIPNDIKASRDQIHSEEGDSTPVTAMPDHGDPRSHANNGQRSPNGFALKRTDSKMNGDENEEHSSKNEQSSERGSIGLGEKDTQPTIEHSESGEENSEGTLLNPDSLVASDAEGQGAFRQSSDNTITNGSLVSSDIAAVSPRALFGRDRGSSVIQNVGIDPFGNQVMVDGTGRAKSKSTVISIPAWQFFRLVPWHNVKGQPSTDFEVAAEFQKRPVVGVCLKRYHFQPDGTWKRLDAIIDIPEEMRLPYTLISDEQTASSGGLPALPREYKFVLQSVICHRGNSLNAGHYISFARVEPKRLRENRRHDFDPPPDYEQAQWVKHDDLDENGRVSYISDLREALQSEFPYLLFYQVMPLQDDEPPPSESSEELPSYHDDFRLSIDEPSTPVPFEKTNGAEHVENPTLDGRHLQSPSRPTSKPSSIRSRPSTEIYDHSRKGSDDSRRHTRNPFSSRPASMNLDSAMQSPARTPDIRDSPMMGPTDETTASRLSRAAAAFRGKQSRNSTPAGETRSAGADMINRMTGMLRAASREPLGEPSNFNLSNANSRANTNARTSMDSAYRPSLDNHREEMKLEKTEKGGGFLSRSGSQKKKDKHIGKKEKADKGKNKESKGDKTPKGDPDQPDRECNVM